MSETLPAHLVGFPFIHWLEVRFRDLDVLGHVNNSVYATYLESTRIEFYHHLTGLPLEKLNIILAELTIKYKAPAFYKDKLGVGIKVASFGSKSFGMEYAIVRPADDVVVASARSVLVMYDYTLNKTVHIPDAFKQRVEEVQGPVGKH
ncbi:acyl-CoA thioesterase [Candidatus Oscillochloris fontis]|uniref:acyl-CoA thioesterase n=1 Tax=Candidatus Oscillochloris fontis TaxID=2496868 RepID=UPI00101D95CC|nr:thioesterase family protein [Candidatus Oscillochloris fontis]